MLNADEMLKVLTIKEKLKLLSGENFWATNKIERLGIPSVRLSDGPHGLRKQAGTEDNFGLNNSVPATCFPSAALLGATFDKDLIYQVGVALSKECKDQKIDVILGPGVNMKRSPLCGRNFEYYSEDPYLSGKIAASFINGLQDNGVGTSIKHFAANSQERGRMISTSNMDKRTLHEIYLEAFRIAIRESSPWTIMASYNQINGVFSCENSYLLKDVLRELYHYDGLVVSDWGAMSDEILSYKNGMNLEMPGLDKSRVRNLLKAYKKGLISEQEIDEAVEPLLKLIEKVEEGRKIKLPCSYEENMMLAQKVAEEGAILLKNENEILPLKENEKVLFVGGFIFNTRYQGAGSSRINPYSLDSIKEAIDESSLNITALKGFSVESDEIDEESENEVLEALKGVTKVVFVGGLPLAFESEGFDRKDMKLPNNQISLLNKILEVNKNVVVVLQGGSPMELPFVDDVKGILLQYLSGERTGHALINLLSGKANPSGRLSETWIKEEKDNPLFGKYPCEEYNVNYEEGQYIGYRYYHAEGKDVMFPFGYGLSYSKVSYSSFFDDEKYIGLKVRNDSDIPCKDVIQVYVEYGDKRKYLSLKDFTKVSLLPHEEKEIRFEINDSYFEFFDCESESFKKGTGEFNISLRTSCEKALYTIRRNIEGEKDIIAPCYPITTIEEITKKNSVKGSYDLDSTIVDFSSCRLGKMMYKVITKMAKKYAKKNPGMSQYVEITIYEVPLRMALIGTNGKINYRKLRRILRILNGRKKKI